MFEYGSASASGACSACLHEREMPMTVFGCAASRWSAIPRPAAAIARRATTCAARVGLDHHFDLPKRGAGAHQEGYRLSAETVATALRLVLPLRPLGEHPPPRRSRGGFLYDSDYYGDELPFWQTVEGKGHLV